MLDTPEQIDQFNQFQDAGGCQLPASHPIAIKLQSDAPALSAAFLATIDAELDYTADGIQDLPAVITTLANECDKVSPAAKAWTDYIDLAAKPDDLMQVSIGVDVMCKVANKPNDKPAASTIPITDGTAVTTLKNAVATISGKQAGIQSLMSQINAAITPPVAPSGPGAGGGATLPPPPLPDDLKDQAMAMIADLEPLKGSVTATSNTVPNRPQMPAVKGPPH